MSTINKVLFILYFGIQPTIAPLQPYIPALSGTTTQTREELIISYFNQGYTFQEIIHFLLLCHGISVSLCHLKRLLKKLGLQRKKLAESSTTAICEAVINELESSGKCLGYKTLWRRLQKQYGLNVKRSTVLSILRLADPDGIESRKRRRFHRRKYVVPGPNYVWHIDGYDKLKPFGFAIHGCIDGYSRRILWLDVASSNNNPRIIAYYYLQTISQLNKLPMFVRGDKGTENVITAYLQQFFQCVNNNPTHGLKSYLEGKSTSNQRIESWWCQLRRHGANWWISYFKDLRDRELFNEADNLQVDCLRYCFGTLIQYDLDSIAQEWNQHKIRKQKKNELPTGKPDVLYFMPECTGAIDYSHAIDENDITICMKNYTQEPEIFSQKFSELVKLLEVNSDPPKSVEDALKLYTHLLSLFELYE